MITANVKAVGSHAVGMGGRSRVSGRKETELGVPLPTTWITEPDGTIIAEEVLPGEHGHY